VLGDDVPERKAQRIINLFRRDALGWPQDDYSTGRE
jgi:hypothetical protein